MRVTGRTSGASFGVVATLLLMAGAPVAAQVIEARPARAAVAPAAPRQSVWIGLAFSCSNCTLHGAGGEPRWEFSTPPELYSVEEGSPAHRAGLRRGDVLTMVDGLDITSDAGGRRWAALLPGEEVTLGYRRGGTSGTVTLRPEPPRTPRPAAVAVAPERVRSLEVSVQRLDSAATVLAQRAERALAERHEQERVVLRQLNEVRRLTPEEVERAEQALVRRQDAQRVELRSQVAEEVRLRRQSEELISALRRQQTPVQAAVAPTPLPYGQQLRYSGTFGGTDVEVRGLSSVIVTEADGELIIRTQDATIRLKRPPR